MEATIEKNELVIRLPISPRPSKSGKTILVASTAGGQKSGVQHDGKEVTISVNAYIPR